MMLVALSPALHAWRGPPAPHSSSAAYVRPPGAMRRPPCPRAPACLRMALSVGDALPPEVLKECCSVQAQRAGKRALLFFYEGDEACAAELAALDEVGGELFLRGCDVHAVRGGGGTAAVALRYPFVTFVEDASGELRAAMGPATAEQAPESYLVDSIGTAVSCCVGASGHAEAAMEYAST